MGTVTAAAGLALVAAAAVAGRASVPLTPAGNGHLVVPAFVNGKGTVPFVLDTGADETSIYDWFARQQRLPAGAAVSVTGQTGTASVPTYRIDRLAVDGRVIRNIAATGLPDRVDAAVTAGIAGNDLMDGAVATFDYPCRTVTLTPKPVAMGRLLTPAATSVIGGWVREGTQLTLSVSVNGAMGTAVLDTGSRGTQINPAFARAAGIDMAGLAPGETLYGAAAQPAETREGKVSRVAFAGRTVRNLTVRVIELPVFEAFGMAGRPAMILGQNALAGMRLLYDHAGRRFWFDRSRCRPAAG